MNKHLPGAHDQKKHAGTRDRVRDTIYLSGRLSVQDRDSASYIAHDFDGANAGTVQSFIESIESKTDFKFRNTVDGTKCIFKASDNTELTVSVFHDYITGSRAAPAYASIGFRNKNGYDSEESKANLTKTLDLLVEEFKSRGLDRLQTNNRFMPLPLLIDYEFVASNGITGNQEEDWTPLIWKKVMIVQALNYIDKQYGLAPRKSIQDISPAGDMVEELTHLPAKYAKLAKQMPDEIPIQDFLNIRHPDYPEIPLFTESLLVEDLTPQYFHKNLK